MGPLDVDPEPRSPVTSRRGMKRLATVFALGLSTAALLAVGSASAEGPVAPVAHTPQDASTTQTADASPGDAGAKSQTAPAPSSSAQAPTDAGPPAMPLAPAEERPMVRARRRPKPRYGAAGCGLGSIIFGAKPGIAQVTAASTNTLGMQTFAITSGTANCDSIDDHETLDAFVTMNREALAKDVARGSGETIATLTAIAGCADPVTVGRALKQSYARIFPGPRAMPEQIARTIRSLLKADAALACENLPE